MKSEVNKMQAVRQALKRMGHDAKPLQIQAYVLKRHNLDIPAKLISNYKTSLLARRADQSTAERPQAVPAAAPAPAGEFSLAEIQAVKDVADRIGVDKVVQLAKVLAK